MSINHNQLWFRLGVGGIGLGRVDDIKLTVNSVVVVGIVVRIVVGIVVGIVVVYLKSINQTFCIA